ncbi:MAG TPA: hypothetical protein VIL79_01235, partial [Thermoleophilia bacterium]
MTPAFITRRVIGPLSLYDKVGQRLVRRTHASGAVAAQRARFYRTAWADAAASVGATVEELGGGLLDIRSGDPLLRVRENLTSLDDPVTLAVAGDKPLVYRLLAARGLPVARHAVCRYDDLATATVFAAGLAVPCVVKPALGGAAGAGVTTGVAGETHLARAMARAGAWSDDVVVEEQVAGDNYRLLYFDGELLDAVLRSPPRVCGDGRSSIAQLVAADNADRARRGSDAAQSLVHVDRDLKNTLRGQGLGLRSVPAAGDWVQIKTVINDNRREDNEAAAARLCGALVEAGAAAAAAVG